MCIKHNNHTNGQVVRVAKEMNALPQLHRDQWPLLAWNILLQAHARLRDGSQGYVTFGWMLRTPGVKPDAFSFLQTIEACARSNQVGTRNQPHASTPNTHITPPFAAKQN